MFSPSSNKRIDFPHYNTGMKRGFCNERLSKQRRSMETVPCDSIFFFMDKKVTPPAGEVTFHE